MLAVFGGRAGVSRLECGRGSCGSSTARPPEERGGPLARPAGQSEREAKRKALRAPRGGRVRLRPYRPEGARSRLISEAKQGRPCLVSWMGDHLGIPGAGGFFAYQKRSFSPRPASQFLDPHPPRPPRHPRSPSPSRGGGSEWVAGAPTPAADLGCLPAAREPLRIRIRLSGNQTTGRPVSLWGSFGLPQAIPGLAPTPARAPAPAPPPASQAIAHAHASARTDRCAQTGHLACWLVLGVDLCLGVGLLNHRLLLLLVPSRTSILFSIPAVPTPIPTQRGGEFPLLHSFSSICYGQTLQ